MAQLEVPIITTIIGEGGSGALPGSGAPEPGSSFLGGRFGACNQLSAPSNAGRALWLKNLHQWHWISSALCLLGMFLFSITGITLNHASQIEAKPSVVRKQAEAPAALTAELKKFAEANDGEKAPLPAAAERWLRDTWSVKAGGRSAEWSVDEVYLPLPKAGGDAWVPSP
eukprot:gene6052-7705_t